MFPKNWPNSALLISLEPNSRGHYRSLPRSPPKSSPMSALAANKQGRRRSVIKVIQDDGSEYFHNEDTGESTWEKPEGYDVIVHEDSIEKHKAKVQEKTRRQSRLSQQLERLRKTRAGGWETCLDNTTGKLYYWHRESGKTQWSIPDPIREARRKAKAESEDAAKRQVSKAAAGGEESGSDTRSAKALWRRASFKIKIVNRVKRLSRPRRTNIMSKDSSDPEHAAEIAAGMEPIDKPDEVRAMIKKAMDGNFVFQMLPKRTVRMMIDVMEGRQVDARTTIIEQGDKGDFFYVIEEGSCDVLVDGNNVATLQPGRSFGELALFYNCPRNASIVAKTECFLWQIDRERFKALMVSGAIQDSSAALTALKSIP